MAPVFGVVITHNRPAELATCLAGLAPQIDQLLVIDNASDPPIAISQQGSLFKPIYVHYDPTQPPNLAVFFNHGLDWAEKQARHAGHDRWYTAIVGDDVTIPDGWVAAVTDAINLTGAAAGSTHQWQPATANTIKHTPDGDIGGRMCGWAFILTGHVGLRADKRLRWWWLDTDLDWQARTAGGMVIAAGPVAHNTLPNDWTMRRPELAEQAGRDGQVFAAKYGGRPW